MNTKEKSTFFDKPVNIFVIAAIAAITVVNQGGYFAGGVVLGGMLLSLFFAKAKPRLELFDIIFLAFSLWYLACLFISGFDVDYTARALIPLFVWMLWMIIPRDAQGSKALLDTVIRVSSWVAVIAIYRCAASCIANHGLSRLIYPMQYANASGIFFGVMLILSRYSDNKIIKFRQYIFIAALLLTQSVGAIAVTVIAEILLNRSWKKSLLIIAVLAVGAFVLKDRVIESMGTFVERILHIRDGLACMADNPLFGIGAGRWETAKQLYQSGFYSTIEIHSSITQIGVSSGIAGLVLFGAAAVYGFAKFRFSNRAHLAAILMLLAHSCLDFSLAFLMLGFVGMIILAQSESKEQKSISLHPWVKIAVALAVFAATVTLAVGLSQIKTFETKVVSKDYRGAKADYESSLLLQNSFEATEGYVKTLFALGEKEKCQQTIDNNGVLSAEMVLFKVKCTDDWGIVLNYLEQQPYNKALYKATGYSNDETLQNKAAEMLNDAIQSASYLGKKLYNIEGEKIL